MELLELVPSSPVIFFSTKLAEPLISSPTPRMVLQPMMLSESPKKRVSAKSDDNFMVGLFELMILNDEAASHNIFLRDYQIDRSN